MTPERNPPLGELGSEPPQRYLRPLRKPEVRRRPAWRQVLHLAPRLLLGLATLAALSGGLYGTYNYARTAPRFRLENLDAVELVNVRHIPASLLRERFREDFGKSIFWIPLPARRRAVEEIPWVAHARVQRFLPNRLRVVLEERAPVAFLRQGHELYLVDAEGVLLERPEGAEFAFPVITGIAPSLPAEERRARLQLYLSFLRELETGGESYGAEISEVDLADPENLRATVTEKRNPVLLHFGRDRFREKYEAYRQHRKLWQKSGEEVHSVDLRYRGQLVLNPEPASPARSEP